MRELQKALAEMGLAWADVWVLSVDRRAGRVVVVATDGRKYTGVLGGSGAAGQLSVISGSGISSQ